MAAGAVSCLIADFRLESECPASLFHSGNRLRFLLLRDGMQIIQIRRHFVTDTILITGGAGFIGRYVARACLERGHRVRVLDSLIEQVHGDKTQADGLDPEVEVVVGDVRDETALLRALKGATPREFRRSFAR